MPKPKKVVVEYVDDDAAEVIASGSGWQWFCFLLFLIFLMGYASSRGYL